MKSFLRILALLVIVGVIFVTTMFLTEQNENYGDKNLQESGDLLNQDDLLDNNEDEIQSGELNEDEILESGDIISGDTLESGDMIESGEILESGEVIETPIVPETNSEVSGEVISGDLSA